MARHPWVAKADEGVRFGVQLAAEDHRRSAVDRDIKANPREALLESGKLVDQLGFDGLFIYDHVGQAPDPWVWLSGLATQTENVMLGSVVNCIYHRSPVYLARLATDLDHLSNGRLMLGLGVGYLPKEFAWLGVEFRSAAERQAGLEEVLEILHGVWGPEPFTYKGRFYEMEEAQVVPPPLQQPRPPIMIGGSGERVTLRQVAQHADACNLTTRDPAEVINKIEALKRHCDDLGRPYDEILKTTFTGWLILAPTEQEAEAKLGSYYEGGIVPGPVRKRINPLVATPEQAVEFYQSFADIGVQYFVAQLPDGEDRETIQLLADEVMPHVR